MKTTWIFGLDALATTASRFIKEMGDYKKIFFFGEVGAGKTTFIKEICAQLKVIDNVNSPTFSLVNEYLTEEDENIRHLDLYRLKDIHEAIDMGIEDILYDSTLTFIEWGEIIAPLYPEKMLKVYMENIDEHQRKISLIKI